MMSQKNSISSSTNANIAIQITQEDITAILTAFPLLSLDWQTNNNLDARILTHTPDIEKEEVKL